jgi:hypothetical protein
VGLMITFEKVEVQGEASYYVVELTTYQHAHLVESDLRSDYDYNSYYNRMYYYLNSEIRTWLNENCPKWEQDSVHEGLELSLVDENHAFMFVMRWS